MTTVNYFLNVNSIKILVGETQPVYDTIKRAWVTDLGNFCAMDRSIYIVTSELVVTINTPSPTPTPTPSPGFQSAIVTPGKFWLLFTVDERVNIGSLRVTVPHIDQFFSGILDHGQLTEIDLSIASIRSDVNLVLSSISEAVIPQDQHSVRLAQILSGTII